MKNNPYKNIPIRCHWKSAFAPEVARPFLNLSDNKDGISITKSDPLLALGSCFATHVERFLRRSGFNFIQSNEQDMNFGELHKGAYSSAQLIGNVYTSRQAKQLITNSLGETLPNDSYIYENNKYFDPLRPSIYPSGFDKVEIMKKARTIMLEEFRKALLGCNWLIITIGLTEVWLSENDGVAFPICPSIIGSYSEPITKHILKYDEVLNDLKSISFKLSKVNPKCKIIFTVSPVHLNATFRNQHVFKASIHSKSVIRAAIEEVVNDCHNTIYFPSYEIINFPGMQHRFLSEDLRNVSEKGVDTVMNYFLRNFTSTNSKSIEDYSKKIENKDMFFDSNIVCEEDNF